MYSNSLIELLITVILLGAFSTSASGEDFYLYWNTIDAGGGYSAGGHFEMEGTIGQVDASQMSGEDFTLTGGFWVDVIVPPEPCPGDLDGDNAVGLADLQILLAHYGDTAAEYADGDLNGDGDVNLVDLQALLTHYGIPCA